MGENERNETKNAIENKDREKHICINIEYLQYYHFTLHKDTKEVNMSWNDVIFSQYLYFLTFSNNIKNVLLC